MSTKHTREVLGTELPRISHTEIARIVRDAEQMRAEHLAGLFRSASRGLAALARAALAALGPQRPRGRAS